MIIVEIGRGLGNSMYVYAGGKALAEHHKTELKLDTSYLDSWPRPKHKFGGSWDPVIEKYNISPYLVETMELVKLRIDGVFGKKKNQEKSLNDFFGK